MKKVAVIVAGGSGLRMGTELPKQFLLLRGKTLLWYSIHAFFQAFDDMEIIVVLPQAHMGRGEAIRRHFHEPEKIQLAEGGETRFHSVQNGLRLVKEPSVVFVHDAVRCLVTPELIRDCYRQTLDNGSAIPAVSATDSIRIIRGNDHAPANRENVRIIQTPQTFQSGILLAAFEQPYHPSFTDEATVVETMGTKVFLIEGDHENIKITRPHDLLVAERILEEREGTL